MIVVSDSSPLITLSKINCFALLEKLFGKVFISSDVHAEVVTAGSGRSGALDISTSQWIEVRRISNPSALASMKAKSAFGIGELSSILLAKELHADLIVVDDLGARKLAQGHGLKVQGCIGVLEASFRKGYLPDLRHAYLEMLKHGMYVDRQLLNVSLKTFNLSPL